VTFLLFDYIICYVIIYISQIGESTEIYLQSLSSFSY